MPHTLKEISERCMDPGFKFYINRPGGVSVRVEHLLKDENMKDEYLGACLDYIRWGSLFDVMYDISQKELIEFIAKWMEENEGNLIWHEAPVPDKVQLPHIKLDECPVDKIRTRKITDLGGRVRCTCYRILDDTAFTLSLEEVLSRLNRYPGTYKYCEDRNHCEHTKYPCTGHIVMDDKVVLPFDGWHLAWLVQRWYEHEEKGTAPLYNPI